MEEQVQGQAGQDEMTEEEQKRKREEEGEQGGDESTEAPDLGTETSG